MHAIGSELQFIKETQNLKGFNYSNMFPNGLYNFFTKDKAKT